MYLKKLSIAIYFMASFSGRAFRYISLKEDAAAIPDAESYHIKIYLVFFFS